MSASTSTITFRTDPDIDRAIAILTADGRSKSEAVRAAILDAERATRRARVYAEAMEIANDPQDRAESLALLTFMEDDGEG